MNNEQELRKVAKEIKFAKIQERKRAFNKAKRERALASSTPMAEGADLKSVQCRFESDLED